ncbi:MULTISPECIES: TetR/AcrR family transcriptional regulator [Pseudomonas]|uniref:Transcriptional regulator, TetR family n=1 Tax=Pseudomonas salomonii TaxID=191391 RepID=A0A1H3SGQ0_9PSED|nr:MULTISPECIES: TetR/AcrR family transcriptional regulator [Pseudomonas]CRM75671.1 Toluene efflux pump ttgABC operon repressor [Pseudomonas sp. 58 R 3]SDZ36850.1 transcriptional regulator, TetR family [Pseudomonas salomonii]
MRVQQAPQLPPRERIVEAAQSLFAQQGITRVSVDAIAALAASTKMTVYRHFENKDALVLEWLQRLTESYSEVLDSLAQQYPDAPREQLLGFTGFIVDDLQRAGYRGCPFTNSLAEIPEPDHPARQLIEAHKQRQFARVATLCEQMGAQAPQALAQELSLLMEGAQVVAQNKGFDQVGERLMHMVRQRL